MINSDFLLSIASICYVICAIPQLIRNLRFKDTITQSLMSNIIILVATLLSLFAYINLNLISASIFLIIEIIFTIILIIQIMIWRKHRKSKRIKEMIAKTEGARSVLKSMKGMK
jgi:hypothetical protein